MTRALAIIVVCIASVALAVVGLVDPQAAARGWLAGFGFVSLFPLGALMLLMIARLTDARWGRSFAPVLTSAAAATPWLILTLAVVALAGRLIYSWSEPSGRPEQLSLYLSPVLVWGRSLLALAGWSWLAHQFTRGSPGRLTAALGLVFHAAALCLLPNDWLLSLRPGWITTNFPMTVAAAEVVAATGLALMMVGREGRPFAGDMAGLLIAGILGAVYLNFMTYLVDWYGNLPDKVSWHVPRGRGLGVWLARVALVVGAGGPAAALIVSPRRYAVAGGTAMFGLVLYCAWLVIGDQQGLFLAASLAASAGQAAALLLAGLAFTASHPTPVARETPAHG